MNQEYRDVGYSGDSARVMNSGNQGSQNRASYIPDNDDNRSYDYREYDNTQFGSSGTQSYRASRMDHNSDGYHSENRGVFGNTDFGNDYDNQDWKRNRNSCNQYGNDNDRNRGQMNQNTSGIGNESGTTNEIIRNVKNDRDSGDSCTGTSNT